MIQSKPMFIVLEGLDGDDLEGLFLRAIEVEARGRHPTGESTVSAHDGPCRRRN